MANTPEECALKVVELVSQNCRAMVNPGTELKITHVIAENKILIVVKGNREACSMIIGKGHFTEKNIAGLGNALARRDNMSLILNIDCTEGENTFRARNGYSRPNYGD